MKHSKLTNQFVISKQKQQKQQQQQQQHQQQESSALLAFRRTLQRTKMTSSTSNSSHNMNDKSNESKDWYKIAVVLNTNARSVTPEIIEMTRNMIGSAHVFATSSNEENDLAAECIIRRGYEIVVPGGGDGTLSSVITAIVQAAAAQADDGTVSLPKFAFLPLGTGNGMGSLVGMMKIRKRPRKNAELVNTMLTKLLQMVEQSVQNEDYTFPLLPCPMIQFTTTSSSSNITNQSQSQQSQNMDKSLCFFAGIGFDSFMLNDFNTLKHWSYSSQSKFLPLPLRKMIFRSVFGYVLALFVRTLPQYLFRFKQQQQHRLSVRVSVPQTAMKDTYWMDPRRGDTATSILLPSSSLSSSSHSSSFVSTTGVEGNRLDDTNSTTTSSSSPSPLSSSLHPLFEGSVGIVAAGSTPYYGGGLKLFPFAKIHPNKFQLRLGRIHPLYSGLPNLYSIFRGTYRDYVSNDGRGCLDFIGTEFIIEVIRDNNNKDGKGKEGYPMQHSGDVQTNVTMIYLRLALELDIQFIDFFEPRFIHG